MNKKKVMERITAVVLSIFTIIMNVPTVYANDNDNVQIINITECEPEESIAMLAEMTTDEVHTLTEEEWADYENWLSITFGEDSTIEQPELIDNSISAFSNDNSCGDGVYYSISGDTLTISGNGIMYNYVVAPWNYCQNDIKYVYVESEVEEIGIFSLYKLPSLERIHVNDNNKNYYSDDNGVVLLFLTRK